MSFENILYSTVLIMISVYSWILCFKIGIQKLRYLPLYLLVTVIIDFWLELNNLISNEITNNVIRYKFYSFFIINFFCVFYLFQLKKSTKYLLIIMTSVLNVYLFFKVDFKSTVFENELSIAIPSYYVFVVLIWFYYKLNWDFEKKIILDPFFWISAGLLLWSTFFFFRIIPAKYMFENDPQFHNTIKSINFIVGTVMYLLFLVALIKFRKQENLE